MKIDFIRLQNYRQYKDVKIEFSTSENQNLTIIQGATGAGKTNLLNAITWCLYGKEKHIEEEYKGYPLINTITINELQPGEKCKVGVQIQLKDEEDRKIIIARSLEFQKLESGKVIKLFDSASKSSDGSIFRMITQIEKDMVDVPEPEYILNELIPNSIEEYFFFDGEKLNDYFTRESGEKIREAVFKISQIGLLKNAIDHLENKIKDFIKKENKLSSRAKEIKEEMGKSYILLEERKNKLEISKEQKEKAQKKVDNLSEKLKTSSNANIRNLEEERNEIDVSLSNIEKHVKELQNERCNILIKNTPIIFAYYPIIKTKKLIGGLEETGEIPSDYKKVFLEKLLLKGICICGTDISENSKYRKIIEEILRQCDDITNIENELIEEKINLRSILNNLKDFRKKQISCSREIKELEKERERKSERLKKISEMIGKSNFQQIQIWEHQLNKYKKLGEELYEKMVEQKFYIKDEQQKIDKLKKQFDEELKKEERHEKLRKVLSFCNNSLEAIKKIKNDIMEEVQREIEEKTEKQFLDLIWKKDTYVGVKIDNNYQISVIDKYGMGGIGTLSAGERQIIALSFIAALNNVSGFNIPIIIDTPLGRLSKEPKKNIASNLLNYLKNKQVTLLVTDEEYNIEVKHRLSKRVGKEYMINFRETLKGSEAKVVPYEK